MALDVWGALRKASWFSLLSFLVRQTVSPFTLEDIWQSVAEPLPSARVGVCCLGEAEASTLFILPQPQIQKLCSDSRLLSVWIREPVLIHSSSATALEIA